MYLFTKQKVFVKSGEKYNLFKTVSKFVLTLENTNTGQVLCLHYKKLH